MSKWYQVYMHNGQWRLNRKVTANTVQGGAGSKSLGPLPKTAILQVRKIGGASFARLSENWIRKNHFLLKDAITFEEWHRNTSLYDFLEV